MSSTVAQPTAPDAARRSAASVRLRSHSPELVLALAMLGATALILYLTRGFTFYYDEWNFIVNRQAFTLDALLYPHNEHNVLVPVLVFKGLWELVGLGNYWAFRGVVVVFHLLCVGLVYVIARRRVGPVPALAPAILLLFLGTAWEVILWPFEIQFLIPAAAGVGALLALERRDLRGDFAAGGLLLVSFFSGSLGIPVAAGASVEILFGSGRVTRLLRVVALPSALYALWLQHYDPYRHQYGSLSSVPKFALEQLGASIAAIGGLHYRSIRVLALVLALALTALVVERFVRRRADPGRLAALATMALAYWGALALYRPWVAQQQPSRYLYAGAVFVLLIAVEIARGSRLGSKGVAALGALVLVAVAFNIGELRAGSHKLRTYSEFVAPGLGALELARGTVDPLFHPEPTRAPDIYADGYFRAVDRFGSPADTPDQILRRPEAAREAADVVLVQALRLRLRSGRLRPTSARAPAVTQVEAGTVRQRKSCIEFRPRARPGSLEVLLPTSGLTVKTAPGSPVLLYLRRFGEGYVAPGKAPAEPLFVGREAFGRGLLRSQPMRLRGGHTGVLQIPADRAAQRWHARIAADQPTVVCEH